MNLAVTISLDSPSSYRRRRRQVYATVLGDVGAISIYARQPRSPYISHRQCPLRKISRERSMQPPSRRTQVTPVGLITTPNRQRRHAADDAASASSRRWRRRCHDFRHYRCHDSGDTRRLMREMPASWLPSPRRPMACFAVSQLLMPSWLKMASADYFKMASRVVSRLCSIATRRSSSRRQRCRHYHGHRRRH